MNTILDKLNAEQIKPVMDTEGAVLVLAGAGSGKTRVLTSRIAYIVSEGISDISGILAITFTNKAAGEMKERLESMLGYGDGKWICTIHSMCVKILREFGESAGIKPNFSIYSETERNNVIKKVFKELDYDDDKLLKSVKYHICNAKMLGLDPDIYGKKYAGERHIDEIVTVYEKYCARLKASNALDFDDLLIETLRLLKRDKETLSYLSDKFRYIHVDEFQDTNAVQYEIIKLLASKHGNLFAVGDDDQSIYGWRGAEIENILKFDKDFPQAKIYKLERNYRSTKSILSLANCIIKNNRRRRGKTLWTEAEEGVPPRFYEADEETGEAMFAARKIKDGVARGARYSDFAILMRINALTRSYEQEFSKYNIPYKVFGGFRFFERKEIKDALAYLRIMSNPFDSEAVERIINVPRRGIGGKTVQAMYRYAEENSLSLFDACVDADYLAVSKGAKEKLKEFASLIKQLTITAMGQPVAQSVRDMLNATDLRSAYDDGTDEGDGKLANIDEFIASVDDYTRLNPSATLDDYLNQVTLSSDIDEMNGDDTVTVATIHAVKGLEFPCVIICGLEEGIMPSSRSSEDGRDFEEERRLMYVAITRAEKELYLTRSKSRYLYGHREMSAPSSFIRELAPELGIKSLGSPPPRRAYDDSGYHSDFPAYGQQSRTQNVTFRPSQTFRSTIPTKKDYYVGQRVRHAKFGIGMIIAIKNGGTVLNVAFDGQGIKELSASLAPLEIIG